MASWINSFLFCICFLFLLLALSVNCLVVFALTFKKRTKLPAFNILMLGQITICLVDIFCNLTLTTGATFRDDWFFSEDSSGYFHLCRFHAFFNSVIPTARIVLIALMALDRVVAIYSPIGYPDRVTRERAWCMVVYCWIHAFVIYVSVLAGVTPVSYRRYHYTCLISSDAPSNYVIIMVIFGFVMSILLTAVFLLLTLKKYVGQEPVVNVIEDVTASEYPTNDPRALARKKSKLRNAYRSLTDFEVAAYVAVLYLVWLICQSPLFVTLASEMILSGLNSQPEYKKLFNNTGNSTDNNFTEKGNLTVAIANVTTNQTSHVLSTTAYPVFDQYSESFPAAFQTTIQYINFIPSLITPLLTFIMYRSVWNRLKHVVAKSRFARRRHKSAIEDEDYPGADVGTNRSYQSAATSRSRQRVRRTRRLHSEERGNDHSKSDSGNNNTAIAETGESSQKPAESERYGTPVLMATADGLLLHQTIRGQNSGNIELGVECIIDENGYLENYDSSADNDNDVVHLDVESDMTSSYNSSRQLLHSHDVHKMETIKGSVLSVSKGDSLPADSGIEDSPTAKVKSDTPEDPDGLATTNFQIFTSSGNATSTTGVIPVLTFEPPAESSDVAQMTSNQGFVAKIGEKAKNGVNITMRRIMGNPSPKNRAEVYSVSLDSSVRNSTTSETTGQQDLPPHSSTVRTGHFNVSSTVSPYPSSTLRAESKKY